jgi:hypothetical protein
VDLLVAGVTQINVAHQATTGLSLIDLFVHCLLCLVVNVCPFEIAILVMLLN